MVTFGTIDLYGFESIGEKQYSQKVSAERHLFLSGFWETNIKMDGREEHGELVMSRSEKLDIPRNYWSDLDWGLL